MLSIHLQDPTDPHSNVAAVVDRNNVPQFTAVSVVACIDFILRHGQESFLLVAGSHNVLCYCIDDIVEEIAALPEG